MPVTSLLSEFHMKCLEGGSENVKGRRIWPICSQATLSLALLSFVGCVSSAPDWIQKGNPGSFYSERYIAGIGACSTKGLEPSSYREIAYRRACAEIAAQLLMKVEASSQEHTLSLSKRTRGETRTVFLSKKAFMTQSLIKGAEILDTYLDKGNGLFYVLAGLNRSSLSQRLKLEIQRNLKRREALFNKLKLARDQGAFGEALNFLGEIKLINKELREALSLLETVSPTQRLPIGREVANCFDPLMDLTCQLRVVRGLGQKVIPGLPLPEPLEVRATGIFAGKEPSLFPLRNLRLQVTTLKGEELKTEPPTLLTDASGLVSFKIIEIPKGEGTFSVRVAPYGSEEPYLKLDFEYVDPAKCSYGVLVFYPKSDRRGRTYIETWTWEAVGPIFSVEEVITSPGLAGSLDRFVNRFKGSDLVLLFRLRLDAFEISGLKGHGRGGFRVEAKVLPRVWTKWGKRFLWTGSEICEQNLGEDSIEAAGSACLKALRKAGGLIRRKLRELFKPKVSR